MQRASPASPHRRWWSGGDSDGVVRPDYGRAFAAAFPNGRFELIAACGHLPQLEQPEALERLVEQFAADLPRRAVSG